jgi:hypothetical protein
MLDFSGGNACQTLVAKLPCLLFFRAFSAISQLRVSGGFSTA